MQAFWEQGFDATSVGDLASATGMNRPSLYAAFGDKSELFVRVLERYLGQMRSSLGAVLFQHAELEAALVAFYTSAVTIYVSEEAGHRGCLMFGVAGVRAAVDPRIRVALRGALDSLDGVLRQRFEAAEQEGSIPRASAALRAQLAASILHSLSVRARAGGSREELLAFALPAVGLLVASSGAGDASPGAPPSPG